MTARVTFRDYLRRIELIELGKPQKQRRATPTITELAEAAGVSRATMSEVINGNRKMLNLKTLGEIVSELQRRGFNPQISDLITIEPD